MAWDTEATKKKILDAATVEFAAVGPDGTTIEKIAKKAGVNKERIYNYFGDKRELLARVLQEELAKVAKAIPVDSFATTDIGDYAGQVYDYHRQRPELTRLLHWEGLTFGSEVPNENERTERYQQKVNASRSGQESGTLTTSIDADHIAFLVLALAGWWFAAPQVARMITGTPDTEEEHARRRASVVAAARAFTATTPRGGQQ